MMVWGMNLPSGFGEFWPDGFFEFDVITWEDRWGDRLKAYYRGDMLEKEKALFDDGQGNGELRYAYYVSQKLIGKCGTTLSGEERSISPIEPHEPPRSFHIVRGGKRLAPLIKLNDRILAVDETLKAIIQRLEPGLHQFFPITMKIQKDQVYPASYHIMVIGQFFDSFSPENSSTDAYRPNGGNQFIHEKTKKAMSGLAFSKATFGDAHLWREHRLSGEWLTCFSDELIAEITGASLSIPKHYRMMEI